MAIHDYNFKKPDKFTWSFIKKIELLHHSFLNNLSQNMNMNLEIKGISADQMTLEEFLSETVEEDYTYHIFRQSFLSSGVFYRIV